MSSYCCKYYERILNNLFCRRADRWVLSDRTAKVLVSAFAVFLFETNFASVVITYNLVKYFRR